jgi:hypothetical protein
MCVCVCVCVCVSVLFDVLSESDVTPFYEDKTPTHEGYLAH